MNSEEPVWWSAQRYAWMVGSGKDARVCVPQPYPPVGFDLRAWPRRSVKDPNGAPTLQPNSKNG